MAVHLPPPDPSQLHPVDGIRLGVTAAGIKKPGRLDLLVMQLDAGASVAGVFTKNRFCAAPVVLTREHLASAHAPVALVVNTGNANAGTGADGMQRATTVCTALAKLIGCDPQAVLPFSTGVILEPLPADRIVAGLPAAVADLRADNWAQAAQAIMTTDTVPKAASRQIDVHGKKITVTGISKGSGMIKPNMATMLGFVATDAQVPVALLQELLQETADDSFNAITVDGDTSTNDALMLIATGASGVLIDRTQAAAYAALRRAIREVSIQLAQAIVRDGEGATKFMTVQVEGGRDRAECRQVAYAIAHSPLVKTAFFASDPNLGRILAAVGYAGIEDLDAQRVDLFLDDVQVASAGGRHPTYREEDGVAVMRKAEILVRVLLHRGAASATVWTCDFSYDYVKINAEYRT